jgi:hypothetical protein
MIVLSLGVSLVFFFLALFCSSQGMLNLSIQVGLLVLGMLTLISVVL